MQCTKDDGISLPLAAYAPIFEQLARQGRRHDNMKRAVAMPGCHQRYDCAGGSDKVAGVGVGAEPL